MLSHNIQIRRQTNELQKKLSVHLEREMKESRLGLMTFSIPKVTYIINQYFHTVNQVESVEKINFLLHMQATATSSKTFKVF